MVEYANMRFTSVWYADETAPKTAVSAPMVGKTYTAYWLNISIVLNLNTKYTPADTSVALCIKAEAGTGASIESGNQI